MISPLQAITTHKERTTAVFIPHEQTLFHELVNNSDDAESAHVVEEAR